MTRADLIADAINTVIRLGWALAGPAAEARPAP